MVKFINFAGYEKTYQAWYGIPKDSLSTNPSYNPYTYSNQTDNYWQSHYQLHITNELTSNLHVHTALHYTKGKGYYESYRENKAYSYYGLPNVSDSITRSDFIDQKQLDNDFYGFITSLKLSQKRIKNTLGISFNRYEGLHYGDVIWGSIPSFSENRDVQLQYQYVAKQYLSNIQHKDAMIPSYLTINLLFNYYLHPK